MALHFGKYLPGMFPSYAGPDPSSGEDPTEIGGWLSETSDDVGDREPVNVRDYTLYFRFVKVQLSAFVTLFSTTRQSVLSSRMRQLLQTRYWPVPASLKD